MRLPLTAVLLAVVVAPAPAAAFKIDKRIIPQPRVFYYVGLDDWKKPMDRVVKALNRAHVGVRLVKAKIPEQASIQVGRFQHQCTQPGVEATTQTLVGGYAAIYLPYNCHGAQSSIIAGHELGHALGLKHFDRRCALMNSSGTGPKSVPTACLGERHPWLKKPWRSDDIAGLKRLYRNTAPKASIKLTGPQTVPVGAPVTFRVGARDKEDNLSDLRIDYGDGAVHEFNTGEEYPSSHSYLVPGTYRIRVSAFDYYRKRGRDSVTVTVTATR